MKYSKVVLVGRQNVGKSCIFNRLADKKRSLVHDFSGVTRDAITDISTWKDIQFKVIDTAGIIFKDNDVILTHAIDQTLTSAKQAAVLVFVVDGAIGLTNEDRQILNIIKKTNKPVIAVANKSDLNDFNDIYESLKYEGFSELIPVSASHNKGFEDLHEAIYTVLKKQSVNDSCEDISEMVIEDGKKKISFALVGRPNVGKSSLLNAMSNKERSIVSEIAGTTRETVSEEIEIDSIMLEISDTAGVRRKRTIDSRLEELMVSNTMNAIKNNEIVGIVLDASAPELYDQDLTLITYAYRTLYKAVLIIWNKIDLIEGDYKKHINKLIQYEQHIFNHLPCIYVSAKTKLKLEKLVPEIKALHRRYHTFLESDLVGRLLRMTLKKTPLMRNRIELKIHKCEVACSAPPTCILYVPMPEFFEDSQLRFLSNVLYKEYNLKGVPIRWIIRKAS